MNLSDYLEVFVPTHIIDADIEPIIENNMIEQTIISCHKSLNLGSTKFTICPDARFKKSHPELMDNYEKYLSKMVQKLSEVGINAVVRSENSETLRGNWIKFVNECDKPYMLFLEHDWEFLQDVPAEEIIKCFEETQGINYLRLSRYDLTEQYFNSMFSKENWDWICHEVDDVKTRVPLIRVSFFSGNPHFAKVSFCKNFIIPALNKYCPDEISKGKSHLEKDIKRAEMRMIDEMRDCGYSNAATDPDKTWGHQWPLSIGMYFGKGCQKCANAIFRQHLIWGNFIYGKKGDKAIVDHSGEWCRKR
jgi:hypothetical protein